MQLSLPAAGKPSARPPAAVCLASATALLPGREVHVPVLLPARLVGLGANRPLLAVADGPQPVGRHPQLLQELLGATGAPVAEAEVVLRRAALVAIAFEHDGRAGEVRQDGLQSARV